MEVDNIITVDTDGALANEKYKLYQEKPATGVWFSAPDAAERTLYFSPNNIRYSAIPNLDGNTYITFLAYNGTLGYSNKVFSTVVAEATGIFDINNAPILEYNAGTVVLPDADTLDDVVMDIKMYNGVVNVIKYSEGYINNGQKTYKVKTISAYPTVITGLPNVSGGKVYLDGWYSYTHVNFRDVIPETTLAIEDSFYGYEGFIFKASISGTIAINSGMEVVIVPEGEESIEEGIVQVKNNDYKEILFWLNSVDTGDQAGAGDTYIHSQVLITDEIRDAIVKEVVQNSMDPCCGPVEYDDWQKLMLKRMAAATQFENELFENAQIIIESSRAMCGNGGYNINCNI